MRLPGRAGFTPILVRDSKEASSRRLALARA